MASFDNIFKLFQVHWFHFLDELSFHGIFCQLSLTFSTQVSTFESYSFLIGNGIQNSALYVSVRIWLKDHREIVVV